MSPSAVPAVDLADATGPVDLLLDAGWLGELVGSSVTARRIRHKPGVSTVASYAGDGGPVCGWVQLAAPAAAEKVGNAERRANERGAGVAVQALTGGWVAVHGPLGTDPRLHRALDQLPPGLLGRLTAGDGGRVLRYNPQRRLVLRRGDTVLRLTEARQGPGVRAVRALAAAGVPTPLPVTVPDVGRGRRVSVWPWVAGCDLLARPSAGGAREAGRLLARWHALTAADGELGPGPAVVDPATQVEEVLDELRSLTPQLARAAAPVVRTLAERLRGQLVDAPAVWSHGDFSADQVIVSRDGRASVIDLDRTCRAPTGLDLGSFAAVELLRQDDAAPAADLREDHLAGYAAAGGVLPAPDALRAWTTYALLLRLTAPLRHARPDWRESLHRRWAQVQEVLDR